MKARLAKLKRGGAGLAPLALAEMPPEAVPPAMLAIMPPLLVDAAPPADDAAPLADNAVPLADDAASAAV